MGDTLTGNPCPISFHNRIRSGQRSPAALRRGRSALPTAAQRTALVARATPAHPFSVRNPEFLESDPTGYDNHSPNPFSLFFVGGCLASSHPRGRLCGCTLNERHRARSTVPRPGVEFWRLRERILRSTPIVRGPAIFGPTSVQSSGRDDRRRRAHAHLPAVRHDVGPFHEPRAQLPPVRNRTVHSGQPAPGDDVQPVGTPAVRATSPGSPETRSPRCGAGDGQLLRLRRILPVRGRERKARGRAGDIRSVGG